MFAICMEEDQRRENDNNLIQKTNENNIRRKHTIV